MAETNGLLNRRTGKSGTEGSNPSVSAIYIIPDGPYLSLKVAEFCGFRALNGVSMFLYCSHISLQIRNGLWGKLWGWNGMMVHGPAYTTADSKPFQTRPV